MKAALATAGRILRQLAGEPRTLGLVFVAPLFIVFLLHAVVSAGEVVPRIAVVEASGGGSGADFADFLKERATVLDAPTPAEAARLLESGEVDASVDLSVEPPAVVADAADPSAGGASVKAIQLSMQELVRSRLPSFAAPLLESSVPTVSFIHGSADSTVFDYLAPVLMCFIVFFLTFILSGIAFLRERSSGTLERAFATPVGRTELVGGYMLGFGLVAAAQTALVLLFVVGVYHAPNAGGFGPALLVSVSIALCALAMGLLLSAFANSEFQMLQFIPIVIIPQILFAGIFNLRSGPAWIRDISWFFPLTYAGNALRDLMLRGRTLADTLPEIAAVWAFTLVFLVLAVAGLGRFRKGGR